MRDNVSYNGACKTCNRWTIVGEDKRCAMCKEANEEAIKKGYDGADGVVYLDPDDLLGFGIDDEDINFTIRIEDHKAIADFLSLRETIVWIPVEEKLPENEDDVLLNIEGYGVTVGFIFENDPPKWDSYSSAMLLETAKVTHWSELPKGIKK